MKILSFRTPRDFRVWLEENHACSEGIFLRFYKKAAGVVTVSHAQALDQALCFGWIDGQRQPCDEKSWLIKFTPRRDRSKWSRINTEHARRLIKSGEMTTAGLKEVETAKADGRWGAAYQSFSTATVPDDFLKKLALNKKAMAFYQTLNKTNLYSIAYRLQTPKRLETRDKWARKIIAMLARGEKYH
ncbi:MAG: YdeI/OmpD-associated family protein [Gammaproteobacteria bacterium]